MKDMFDLPEIVEADFTDEVLERESEILELVDSLISQGAADLPDSLQFPPLYDHRSAVTLANEILSCHASESLADEAPSYCAEQLKCWHLRSLDIILDRFLQQD